MRPKKKIVDRAFANGSMDRVNQLMSANFILIQEAINLLDEATDIMKEQGLLIGMLKKLQTDFFTAADRYSKAFASLIPKEQSKNMFSDYEEFDNMFRDWAKLPLGWKPKDINDNAV